MAAVWEATSPTISDAHGDRPKAVPCESGSISVPGQAAGMRPSKKALLSSLP